MYLISAKKQNKKSHANVLFSEDNSTFHSCYFARFSLQYKRVAVVMEKLLI